MKAAFTLLCALGTSSSTFFTQSGKPEENVWTYHGKVLTGIPELDHTYAGMAIDCEVIFQVNGWTDNIPGKATYKMALKDVKFSNFNEKLTGAYPLNWRTMEVPATAPVPEHFRAFLESPVVVDVENWEVKKLVVSAEEPEWTVNFKKAIVAAIKVQMPVEEESLNRIPRSQMPHVDNYNVPAFWSVMEQGVDGVCENTYQVTEIPKYLISEFERGLIKPEFCEGKKVFQMVRNRDITKCTERSLFISARGHDNCLVGKCNGINGKTAMTRFIGCGVSKETMTVHAIINEGEHHANLLAFNTEKVMTGTRQVLTKKEVRTTLTALPAIAAPRNLEDLMFEYPKAITAEERKQITSFKRQQDYYKIKAVNPAANPSGVLVPMDEAMKTRIVEKFAEAAHHIHDMEHFGKKQVTATLQALKNVITFFNVAEIKAIFAEVKEKHVERRLFLDTVIMAGTNPCIMFCKEMIEANEFSLVETTEVLLTLPHNIKTPTMEMIEEIFQLIKSPRVAAHRLLKTNAHLAFATILNRACFAPMDKIETTFPEHVLGKMCRPEDPKIHTVYIPHLVAELTHGNDNEKHAAILALGTIGHAGVVPILLPYIEGKATTVLAHRRMAIYGLAQSTYAHREILLPIYSTLVHNPAEDREIRIAALSMMMRMDPTTVHLQKLAVATWFEEDEHVHRFIWTTLKTLSEIKRAELPAASKMMDLVQKAATVLPLAKPVPGVFSATFNIFVSEMMKNLDVGYEAHTAMLNSAHTHVFYYKIEAFLKQARTVPFEFAAQATGLRTFILEALKAVTDMNEDKIHVELKAILAMLEVMPKADFPMEALFWGRFSDDFQFILATPEINAEYFVQKMKEIMRQNPIALLDEVKRTMCGKTPFHLTKAFEVLPYAAIVPSEMGFPVFIETQYTQLFNVKGEIDIECAGALPTVEFKTHKKSATSWTGYAGVISPFTKELIAAGVNTHRAINVPVQAIIKLVPSTGAVKIEWKQMDEVTPMMTNVDFVHYHVHPFTTIKPLVFQDLTPIVLDFVNTKILESNTPKREYITEVGKHLGLDIKFHAETECALYDKKALLDTLANYRYNPYAAMVFLATETALRPDGTPTIRFHKYTLIHNPHDSTTKALEIDIKMAAAIKIAEEIKHFAIASPKKIMHEEKITNCISKITGCAKTYAANALVEVKLIGGLPKTYEYSFTFAKGHGELVHKWNLEFESEHMPRKVCVHGGMEYPITRNIQNKFKYDTRVEFGNTCQEHFINLDGHAITSEKQREFSRRSEVAKECNRLTREVFEIYNRIQAIPEGARKMKFEKEHRNMIIQKDFFCEKMKKENTALDKVEMEITYSPHLHGMVHHVARYLDSVVKAFLVEYISEMPAFHERPNTPIKIIVGFNQRWNSLNLRLTTPMDTTTFKDIRMPAWAEEFLPLCSAKPVIEQFYKVIFGSPFYSKCFLTQGTVNTFDKKSYNYQLDDCYHLVASDCSKRNSHAVLAKEKNGVMYITIFHENNKIVLKEPATRYTRVPSAYKVEVNGVDMEVTTGEKVAVVGTCTIHWSRDNMVTVDTPAHRIQYNGKALTVEDKSIVAGENHCGLCGDYNKDKRGDLKANTQCVYWSIKSMAHSYRVKDAQCISQLSRADTQNLEKEKRMCNTNKVWQASYNIPRVEMMKWKHAVVHQTRKVCVSKEAVPECAHGYRATETEAIEVDFVCLPAASKATKMWVNKAYKGEPLPELANMAKTLTSTLQLPKTCIGA